MPFVSDPKTQSDEISGARSLEEIYALIAADMKRVDSLTAETLASEYDFVGEITDFLAKNQGKRVRAALVLLACQACDPAGGSGGQNIMAATAVEMIHNATLIHDDVVDNSPLRRGLRTPHSQWGKEVSVLMGDYLLARVVSLLSQRMEAKALRVIAAATSRVCEGEIKEVRSRFLVTQTEKDYFEIIEKKTAALMSACCETAALVSGAGEERAQSLSRFGLKFGIAFQIVDDLLDLVADPAKLGKPLGNDLREGKITLPLLHGLSEAPEAERQNMRALLLKDSLEAADMAQVMRFIRQQGGMEYSRAKAHMYIEEAKAELSDFPASEAKICLLALADYVLARDY